MATEFELFHSRLQVMLATDNYNCATINQHPKGLDHVAWNIRGERWTLCQDQVPKETKVKSEAIKKDWEMDLFQFLRGDQWILKLESIEVETTTKLK